MHLQHLVADHEVESAGAELEGLVFVVERLEEALVNGEGYRLGHVGTQFHALKAYQGLDGSLRVLRVFQIDLHHLLTGAAALVGDRASKLPFIHIKLAVGV